MEEKEHKYPEAFCIMKYSCDKCGHEEFIWNSRNGVTPFMVECKHEGCTAFKNHINYRQDLPVPGLKPMGVRWFVDLTREAFEENIEKTLDVIEKKEGFPVSVLAGEMSREQLRESYLEGFNEGGPTVYDPRKKEVLYDDAICPGP